MSKLRVDLQEGFTDDEVYLHVNGVPSLRKQGVTTKRFLGLATSSEIEVPEGTVNIEIKIPTKNLAKTISLNASGSDYLGVSVGDGKIQHIVSQKPFGYA